MTLGPDDKPDEIPEAQFDDREQPDDRDVPEDYASGGTDPAAEADYRREEERVRWLAAQAGVMEQAAALAGMMGPQNVVNVERDRFRVSGQYDEGGINDAWWML